MSVSILSPGRSGRFQKRAASKSYAWNREAFRSANREVVKIAGFWKRGRAGSLLFALAKRWFSHFFADYRVQTRPELDLGLRGIRCKTAVIWGDRAPYCPFAIAEDLAAKIPGADLHRIAGADHYVMEERPDEVLSALTAWLAAGRASFFEGRPKWT